MAYTTIDDPSVYFQAQTYTGNGSDGLAVTNTGNSDLQPDWLWIKKRSGSGQHVLVDSTRGTNKQLFSSLTDVEQTSTNFVASLDSDGFTVNDSSSGTGDTNATNGGTYVAWQWKANGGTTSSDSNGSITSTVQANTTAGFSIVTWTGSGTSNETVGHGLTTAPEVVILKPRTESRHWLIWFDALGDNDKAFLFNNETAADNRFGPNAPTSSVFGLYGNQGNRDGTTFVAYAFHSVKGYSKIGSYTGNNSTDGVFVYTGFKPAWLMVKKTDGTANWDITTAAISQNQIDERLRANLSNAEESSGYVDFLSNGFKMRNTNGSQNNGSYIYMAFAEHAFVSSKGVPVTAR